ncbi:receptor-like protein kinase hsl1 [Phtheirospermum japonicum]|uniref:Receptor-like protein kinase hsl1 n=1 Tax=Phtheirospermum japonicum TaxID=374723 RepID=A0A830C5W6_9LAMI|nr:receptor-like protein kinase hsl1 [Phtheirospermum japonicum]
MSFKYFILVLVLSLHNNSSQANPTIQAQFFDLIKKSANGDSLSNWESANNNNNNNNYCNFTGIGCDDQHNIVRVDITGWSLTGIFPDQVCLYLPQLRVLRLGHNSFDGQLPRGITNCSSLQELNATHVFFTGPLPDFSPLAETLKILDLSYNHFSGNFPISVTNLTGLEILDFNENTKLNPWRLPDTISSLTNLRSMILTTCMLHGKIPTSLGNMTSLTDLELSGNYLTGHIPIELGRLKNLKLLELYYNQLEGEIPDVIGNLTGLLDLDMSVNRFTGEIPESICRLPNIRVLQLYNNSLTGEIPNVLANSTTLITLSLYSNFLTGRVPQDLGRSSAVVGVDLSENQLTGKLPEGLCSRGKLKYLLLLQNFLSGEIPESYAECGSLIRFRVSNNNLGGNIPGGIFSLPHASIIDLEKNDLTGSIPGDSIRNARNLSELFMQGNRISGLIPPEISLATNLVKIDLSNNFFSGPIPSEIGNLRWLNLLLLQNNELSSSIPESLSSLKSLNVLDLSSNRLTGKIPESLDKLLPNSLNFSNNRLSGEIPFPFIKGGVLESFAGNPSLCVPAYKNTSSDNFPICPQAYDRKKINSVWLIGVLIGILIIGTVVFLRKWYNKNKRVYENEDAASSSFFSYDMKSFHRLSFDQREIIDAMVDKNIVGYGGSGAVYRVEINNGTETVAVKKLWGRTMNKDADDHPILDRELKTEVETLGSIRHKNIVKLYCYFSSLDCSLLVYEYMTNGNLWDALHGGKSFLDWPIRHQIALGVAQGLAYLHNDLVPPIVHRDIKSTNILLDVDYLPKVADFGIAKVLQARGSKDSSTTVIAGTYGYLAPEYAYSSKATTKCDVYSFGVVLMELLTGKKPVEPEFGENKNIIYWVSTKVETKEGATDVLDKRVLGTYKEDMIKVLRIAIRCTCRTPNLRPTMSEVVQLLMEADPCKFDCCKFSNKNKETENDAKIKVQLDL